jgi:hypothetical protein
MQRHVFDCTEKRKQCRPNETDSSTLHWSIELRSGMHPKAAFWKSPTNDQSLPDD